MSMRWKESFMLWRLSFKRLLKRKRFWAILVLLPVTLLAMYFSTDLAPDGLQAVVYSEDTIWKDRLSVLDNPSFYFVDSKELLKEEVLLGKAECGYVIPKDLIVSFEKEDWYWEIEVYEGSHSMFTKLINEVLFGQIFDLVSTRWYADFMEEKLAESGVEISKEEMDQVLLDKLSSGETFQVETVRLGMAGGNDQSVNAEANSLKLSARNVVAIMVYLVSLVSVIDVVKDREERHFQKRQRFRAAVFTIFNPAFCVALSGVITMCFTGDMFIGQEVDSFYWIKEVGSLLLLICFVTLYALGLSFLVRKSRWMYGLLPVLFVSSLVCCPVFIDLSAFIPIFQWLKVLFPVAFYL